jgi:hypothetical protein
MTVVFDGAFPVHYGQAYVLSVDGDIGPDFNECFRGQRNGLLGAASPGRLWLTTGLHTGQVRLRVEVHDSAPPVDAAWEEIVEASFTPAGAATGIYPWAEPLAIALDLAAVSHRARWCATEMDTAREQDTLLSGEPLIDSYALVLWPAPVAPDEVVRQTSEVAAYWHRWAQGAEP